MSSASFLRFGQQAGHGRDPGDQPDAQRFGRVDTLGGQQHIESPAETDHACQTLSAAGARYRAAAHFRQRERGVCRRNANVAGERDLQAAAQAMAVYGRDERFPGVLESADPVMVRARLAEIAEGSDIAEPFDVGACANARSPAPFSKITRTSDPRPRRGSRAAVVRGYPG